jgi:hypothetical protein
LGGHGLPKSVLKRDIFIGLFFFLLSLVTFYYISQQPWNKGAGVISPSFYPKIGTYLFGGASLILVFQSLISLRTSRGYTKNKVNKEEDLKEEDLKEEDMKEEEGSIDRRVWWLIAAWCLYPFFFESLGFLLITPPILAFTMWYWGLRDRIRLLVLSILSPIILFSVFWYIFNIQLPKGILG